MQQPKSFSQEGQLNLGSRLNPNARMHCQLVLVFILCVTKVNTSPVYTKEMYDSEPRWPNGTSCVTRKGTTTYFLCATKSQMHAYLRSQKRTTTVSPDMYDDEYYEDYTTTTRSRRRRTTTVSPIYYDDDYESPDPPTQVQKNTTAQNNTQTIEVTTQT